MKGYGLTLLRVTVGATYLLHAYRLVAVTTPAGTATFVAGSFGVPHPTLAAWGLIAAYGLGGLLLVVGLLTRPAAAVDALISAVMLVRVDLPQGLSLWTPASFEHALLLTAATIAILTLGSGPLALRPSR
jgi:putative oxidoreductase